MFNYFNKSKQTIVSDKIMNDLIDLCDQGTPFGSRVWGGHKEKSDYDIMADRKLYKQIIKFCNEHSLSAKTSSSDNYNSLFMSLEHVLEIRINGRDIQICNPSNDDVDRFKMAVGITNEYAKTHDMSTRDSRVEIFDKVFRFTELNKDSHFKEIYHFTEKHCPEYLI